MKKIFIICILLSAFAQRSAFAQIPAAEAINYETMAPGYSGIGSYLVYGYVTATVDSVWTQLEATGTIGGVAVYDATKVSGTSQAAIQAGIYSKVADFPPLPASALWPYKVAGAFNGATVSAGVVTIPSGGLGTVAIAQGGTGATTAAGARTNLGIIGNGGTVPAVTQPDSGGTGLTTYTTGDLLYSSNTNVLGTLGIGSTNQMLIVASGKPSWTTNTWPASTSVSQLLYASSANTITGLTTANNGVLVTSNTGVPSILAGGTAGTVLTANTGAAPSWKTGTPTETFDTVSTSVTVAAPTTAFRITCLQGAGNLTDTIAAPTAAMNGYIWHFTATTAHIYTLYCTTDGFNAKGSSGNLATAGNIGDNFAIVAMNLHWMWLPSVNTTKN